MLRSILMTSGAVTTMWRSEEKPAPTSSLASRTPAGRAGPGGRAGAARAAPAARAPGAGAGRRAGGPGGPGRAGPRGVVLDRVVLGELEQDAVQGQLAQQVGEPRRQQGLRGDGQGGAAVDPGRG